MPGGLDLLKKKTLGETEGLNAVAVIAWRLLREEKQGGRTRVPTSE